MACSQKKKENSKAWVTPPLFLRPQLLRVTLNPPGVGPRPLHFPIPGRWLEYRTNDPIPPSADPDDGLNLAGFTGADMRELQRRNIIRPLWLSFYNSSGIGHSDLQVLRGFGDLRGIDQNFCERVGDAGIREASALENLE